MKTYTQEQVDKIITNVVDDMHEGYVKIISFYERKKQEATDEYMKKLVCKSLIIGTLTGVIIGILIGILL
ncbi:hypothetical protein [Mammaliicoccus fleurettii]|uniref:hypothetical protein n=1 Tax=Mammaliicoccus fleurettii TaxID=150056 RepID=UPI000993B105|nr:hypothetical protein [Mammaliicoccus fleurettii]OOV78890.1 hypothetical protein B2G86_00770 [Mammaliicoccus fleurettii]